MRIILSRKGFDTGYGRQASPILPDGTLLSIPIPSKKDTLKYSELKYMDKTYFEIIKELNPNSKVKDYYTCHLDPDIRYEVIQRDDEWVPLFGQTGSAQGHLSGNGISVGDLFLFFGTFRNTKYINGLLTYDRNSSIIHLIFGFLQIGEICNDFKKISDRFPYHPHSHNRYSTDNSNCVYKANDKLSFFNELKGYGCFKFNDDLILTKKDFSKSRWKLPDSFKENKVNISYHNQNSYTYDYFQSAAKGQEFIFEENENVTNWAKNIIRSGTNLY